jgi:hypothetical protein
MALPIILSGEITCLASLPAMTFLLLFTLLFVPLVWAELFDSDEWARGRAGAEAGPCELGPFLFGLAPYPSASP